MRAVTKHAVNNMASWFEPSAHPYVLSNLFTGLHAKMDLPNSLLESISEGEEKRERFAELGHQLEVKIQMVAELPQGTTTTTVYIIDATAAYCKQLLILFQRADTFVEVFEGYDHDISVKTAELDRRAGPTAPCK